MLGTHVSRRASGFARSWRSPATLGDAERTPFRNRARLFQFSTTSDQAASHADWVTSFDFAHEEGRERTYNDVRNIVVNLPAGFDASDTAVPTCSQAQLVGYGRYQ